MTENNGTPGPEETPGPDGGAPAPDGTPDADGQVRSEQVDAMLAESASAVRLFDVRRIIGGLFVVYGIVVGVMGLLDGPEAIRKAQGVNVNLWTGVGMLILGLLFLLWMFLRPAKAPDRAAVEAERH